MLPEPKPGSSAASARPLLSYADVGSSAGSTTLVLLHSLGADGRMWDACVAQLEDEYRVIVPDTRGHGRSGVAATSSVQQWVDDLDDVLRESGSGPAVLVGVSLGGIQALAYAAAHPERVAGLVVADSFVALPHEVAQAKIGNLVDQARLEPMASVADQYVADTFQRPHPSGAEAVRLAMAAMDVCSYVAAVEACFAVRIEDRLVAITSPVLVLWGDRDAKTPRALSEEIVAGLSEASLEVVQGAGHLSNVDNPTGFVSFVDAFVSERVALSVRMTAEGGH